MADPFEDYDWLRDEPEPAANSIEPWDPEPFVIEDGEVVWRSA